MLIATAARLDAELQPWRTRELKGEYPYVFLDARYDKVRRERRIVDIAVLVAIGVNAEGFREVVGVDVARGESKATLSGRRRRSNTLVLRNSPGTAAGGTLPKSLVGVHDPSRSRSLAGIAVWYLPPIP